MKEKIVKILMDEFSEVYCYNCAYEMDGDSSACEWCHRKSIAWSLDKATAESLADEIIKECGL